MCFKCYTEYQFAINKYYHVEKYLIRCMKSNLYIISQYPTKELDREKYQTTKYKTWKIL